MGQRDKSDALSMSLEATLALLHPEKPDAPRALRQDELNLHDRRERVNYADSGKGNADVRVESWMPTILIVVSVMVLKYMQRSGRGAELYEACQHYFFPASPDPAM